MLQSTSQNILKNAQSWKEPSYLLERKENLKMWQKCTSCTMEASKGKGKRSKNFNMWYGFLQPCPCLFCIPHRNQERASWRYCRRIGRIRNNTEDDAQSYKSAKLKKILKMILLYWVKGEPGIGKKEVASNAVLYPRWDPGAETWH